MIIYIHSAYIQYTKKNFLLHSDVQISEVQNLNRTEECVDLIVYVIKMIVLVIGIHSDHYTHYIVMIRMDCYLTSTLSVYIVLKVLKVLNNKSRDYKDCKSLYTQCAHCNTCIANSIYSSMSNRKFFFLCCLGPTLSISFSLHRNDSSKN